jgi:hypothetical protein
MATREALIRQLFHHPFREGAPLRKATPGNSLNHYGVSHADTPFSFGGRDVT